MDALLKHVLGGLLGRGEPWLADIVKMLQTTACKEHTFILYISKLSTYKCQTLESSFLIY